jgi:hypothetical protein
VSLYAYHPVTILADHPGNVMLAFVRRNEEVRKNRELSRSYATLFSFITARIKEGHY